MATQTTANKRPNQARPTAQKSAAASTAAPKSAAGTPERDEVYGLVSVLYHALQGAETYGKYIEDARRSNDSELVTFFQETQTEENARATRAKRLLAARLEGDVAEDEDEDEEEEDDEDDDDEDEDEEEEED